MTNDQSTAERNPTLSIIIPVFNTETYLEEALNSVLSQDFTDLEIIAINDGSEDRSGKILDSYRDQDSRISVYHRKNSGLSATRNFGLKKAGGTFVYFFDSDDRLVPGALNSLVKSLRASGSEVIGFSGRYIDEAGQPFRDKSSLQKPDISEPVAGEKLLVEMMRSGTYSPVVSMYMYRNSFLQNNQLSFREGYIHEDEFYTIRALCMADRALSVSDIYYEHRIRDGSIMAEKPGMNNLKGWSEAVSQILGFVHKYPVKQSTKKMILKRAGQLAHNSVKIIQQLNKEENMSLSIDDYITRKELDQLGMDVRFRYNFPQLFKVYNRIKKL